VVRRPSANDLPDPPHRGLSIGQDIPLIPTNLYVTHVQEINLLIDDQNHTQQLESTAYHTDS
jgi:hypothetical protein